MRAGPPVQSCIPHLICCSPPYESYKDRPALKAALETIYRVTLLA